MAHEVLWLAWIVHLGWTSALNAQTRHQEESLLGRGKLQGSKDTFAFQTRYETTGLLQVVGVTSEPPGVNIRYKLIKNSRSPISLENEIPQSQSNASSVDPSKLPHPVVEVAKGEGAEVYLGNGITAEVIGVLRNPRNSDLWLRPDGFFFDSAPAEIVQLAKAEAIGSPAPAIVPENEVLVFYRIKTPQNISISSRRMKWQPRPHHLQIGRGASPTVRGIDDGSNYAADHFALLENTPTVNLTIELVASNARWEAVAEFDGEITKELGHGMVLFSPPRFDERARRHVIDVMHNLSRKDQSLRLVAHLKGGQQEVIDFHSGVLSRTPTKGYALVYPDEVEMDEVEKWILERTPWLMGEIKNIAVQPSTASVDNTPSPVVERVLGDGIGFDIDTGVEKDIRNLTNDADLEKLDVVWDSDGGGAFMRNPIGKAKVLPLPDALDFADAVAKAFNRTALFEGSKSRGGLASESRFFAVLTDEERLAVVEIKDYNSSRAIICYHMKVPESANLSVVPELSLAELELATEQVIVVGAAFEGVQAAIKNKDATTAIRLVDQSLEQSQLLMDLLEGSPLAKMCQAGIDQARLVREALVEEDFQEAAELIASLNLLGGEVMKLLEDATHRSSQNFLTIPSSSDNEPPVSVDTSAQVVDISHSASFGSVIERVLFANETLAESFLDVDTGQVLSPPSELVASLKTQGQIGPSMPQVLAISDWARDNGVDFMLRVEENRLVIVDGFTIGSATPFDSLDADRIVRFSKNILENFSRKESGFHMSMDADRPEARSWIFLTREGGMGVLEISDIAENSSGMKFRYKLVQEKGATKPSGELTRSEAARQSSN